MDTACSEKCLLKIALLQFDWKILGRRLLNTEQDVKDIDRDEKEEQHKRDKVLLKWKDQQPGATYRKLTDIFRELKNKDTADRVEQFVVAGNAKPENFDMLQTNCGCGKCDVETIISNGCPKQIRKPFLYLDTSSLTEKQEGNLLSQLKKDADAIYDQWDTIVHQFNSWMDENISLKMYKEILLTVPGVTTAIKEVPLLSDRKQEIVAAKDHLGCFAILSDYCSWFNYSILEAVVSRANKRTQKDSSEFLSSLRSYVDQLHIYCKRNIFECPKPSDTLSTKSSTFLVLKVNEDQLSDVNKVSAEKIKLFKIELMKPFEIQDYTLNLHTVDKGCVRLEYSIPLCIYNELFPLNEDQCKSLPMLGVIEVITMDYHYKKNGSTLQLQPPLPSKTIGADGKQDLVHHAQENSPPSIQIKYEAGLEKDSIKIKNPSKQESKRMNVLHTMTHHDMIARHDIPVLIVGILLLIAKDFWRENWLLNVVVWSMLIFSSLVSSYYYILILSKTFNKIRSNIIVWQSLTIFVLGLISSYILQSSIIKELDNIHVAEANFDFSLFFYCTSVVRMGHCCLEVWIFSLVSPISNIWVSHLAQAKIIQLDSMIYYNFFLYIYWLMFTGTFGIELNSTTLFLHLFSLVYRTIELIWIMQIRSATQDVHTPIQETGLHVVKNAREMGTVDTAAIIALAISANTLAGSEMVFPT